MSLRYCSRFDLIRRGQRGLLGAAIAAAIMAGGARGTQDAVANGDTRTLSLHHTHTGESATITFKRDGRYDEDALKKLNWFLRDWRRDEATRMDPHLFDIVWEVYREVGGSAPVRIVSAYRSPATNAMLRSRSRGVAQFSQHTLGKAMDFYIPGADLAAVREAGLRLQRGGVGFYPTSGSPFVHLDTGSVRHWPRMTRQQLARVFPDGKTVHLPSDGRPLSGYEVAARDIERRGGAVRGRTLMAARVEPDEEGEMTNDGRVIYRSRGPATAASAASTPRRSLFAWLGGDSEDKNEAPARSAPAAETPPPAQAIVAQAIVTQAATPAPGVPLPPARPSEPTTLAAAPAAAVPVRPYEPTISVAQAEAPGAFAAAPRAVAPSQSDAGNLRWVTGPSGKESPAPQDVAAAAPRGTAAPGTPLPRPRPGSGDGAQGFALAQAASRPVAIAASDDTTASLSRGLPPEITAGVGGSQPDRDQMVLAYAVVDEAAAPRALPVSAPVSQPVASRAAAQRQTVREPLARLTAPRTEGPGLPRLIIAARFDTVRVDLRHPDAKAAASLLRGSRGALDLKFSREHDADLTVDHFAGPAIRPLPVARFEVAALQGDVPVSSGRRLP